MRLDAFLKKTHLLKRRELARELCEEGMVRINGVPRKASVEIKAGDEVQFPLYNRILKVRVLEVPQGNVSKSDQWSYFEVLEEKKLLMDEGWDEASTVKHKSPTEH